MRRKNDILWKVVMEEVFDDLLRFIYPDADEVYNLERGFEFLDRELAEMYPEPEKQTQTRFADKLVKVFDRNDQEEWVLCHVEIQGETKREERPLFGERMFRYYYRILDRYRKPVSAMAIFTGPDGNKMPDRFEYAYRKTRLIFEYPAFAILNLSDEELEASDNPFALVVQVAKASLLEGKIPEQDLFNRKILIASNLLKRGISAKKIRAILVFLENYVCLEDPEMNRNLKEIIHSQDKNNVMGIDEYVKMVAREEGLEEGRKEGLQEGLQEGLREGEEKKSRLAVENLLSATEFSDEKIASLVDVPVSFVEKIKRELALK